MIAEKNKSAQNNADDNGSVKEKAPEKPAAMDMDNMEKQTDQNQMQQSHEMDADEHKDMKKLSKKAIMP